MPKILSKIIAGLMVIILLSGCISKKEIAFAYAVPIGDMNSSIKLKISGLEDNNNIHIGDEIPLAISNISNYDMLFPPDFGVEILSYDEGTGEWNFVGNGIEYDGTAFNELPRMAGDEAGIPFKVLPILENNGQSINIRVVVQSKTTDLSLAMSKDVGAFIDLTLQP